MRFNLNKVVKTISIAIVFLFSNSIYAQCVTGAPALNCGVAYTADQNDALNGTSPDPSCATTAGPGYGESDWYEFTYTGNEAFGITDTQFGVAQNFAVYSGDGCTEFGCSLSRTQKLNSIGSVQEMAIIDVGELGLTIGTTYLLRVFNNGDISGPGAKTTFAGSGIGYTIGCSEILADSDDCIDAITVSDGFVQTGVTTINATIDAGLAVPSCVGTLENLVFYRFCGNTLGDPVNINLTNITYTSQLDGGAANGFQYTIWSGDCGGLVEEDCAGVNGTTESFVFDPDPCSCYYFSIDGINGDGVTFDLEFLNANNNPLEVALDNIQHESCAQCDGLIDITISGGNAPYTISWVGPAGFTSSDEDINTLCDGDYIITIVDNVGCSITQTYNIINAVGVGTSVAGFTVNDNTQCLTGNSFVFTNTGTTGGGTVYTWEFDGDAIVDDTNEDPSFSYSSAGVYTVTQTVDDGGGCVATSTSSVTVYEMPTITGEAPICIGADVTLTGSGTPDATTPWSSSDDGIATVSNTGVVTGVSGGVATITYLDNVGCTITVDVTVNPDPTITGATPICIDETLQLVGSATANGVQPWTSSSAGIATIGSTGLVTGVSAGTTTITYVNSNSCQNTVDITVNPSPLISTTQTPLTGCNSNDGIIEVSDVGGATGTVTWTGTAAGSALSQTLPYDITNLASGTYNVTFTDDASGCTSVISQEVFINPGAPVINPVSDTTSCDVDYTLLNSIITGSGLTGGQAFYTATGGPTGVGTLIPDGTVYSATTNVNVFLYDENGACSSEQTFSITVNPLPTISGETPICIGSTVQLTGSGVPNASTPWSSSNTSVATVSSSGLVSGVSGGTSTITYINSNNCENSVLITVNPDPTISDNVEICITGTNQLTGSGSPAVVSPWISSSTGVATIDNAGEVTGVTAGTSTITYTDNNGCQTTELVTVNPNPVITNNSPICIGATVQLAGSGTANSSTPWVSSNTSIATVNNSGLVFGVSDGTTNITYTNSNGCEVVEVVTVNPDPIISTSQTGLTLCNSDDGILHVSDAVNATGTVTWTGTASGSANSETLQYNITGLAAGTYNVTFTDDLTGCTSSVSQEIFVNPGAPILDDLPNVFPCDTYTLPTITGTSLSGSQSYWSETGGTGTQFTEGTVINSTTLFYIYDINGACSDEQLFNVTILNTPEINILDDVVNCGEYVLPIITGTNLTGSESFYSDSQSNGGIPLPATISATQTVWVYDANGVECVDEISFEVTIASPPSINSVTGGGAYCENDIINEITIDLTGEPDWIVNYTLDGTEQSITSSISPVSLGQAAGIYVVTGISDLNCDFDTTLTRTIVINESPLQPNAGSDIDYCGTSTIDSINVIGNGGEFNWYADAELTQFLLSGSSFLPGNEKGETIYYVTETLNGCVSEYDDVVISIIDCNIIVPTAFTPDGDGVNDDWEILDIDQIYPNSVVKIYNRWGNLLFESEPGLYGQKKWNGNYDEKRLPVGSYYFIIEFNDDENGAMSGSVSIIDNN